MRFWLALVPLWLLGFAPVFAASTAQNKSASEGIRLPPAQTQSVAPVPSEKLGAGGELCADSAKSRTIELCAQWAAADAAVDQARWTKYGALMSVFGILSLLATIWYTRKAVRLAVEAGMDTDRALIIAENNATATAELARVSQDTSNRQLRPHVHVTECEISFGHLPAYGALQDMAPIVLTVKNFGRTPAKAVHLRARAFIGGEAAEDFETAYSGLEGMPLGDLPPDFVKTQPGYRVAGLKNANEALVEGTASIFVDGMLAYEDSTGGNYETRFRLVATGRDYEASRFAVAGHGNGAS